MFENIDFIFRPLKSIRVKKKNGHKSYKQNKSISKKLCKKIAILIYPPFRVFRKKNCPTKVVFLVRKYTKKVFL
jgi:hypothetical protein